MVERFLDLVDLFERSCGKNAHRPAFGTKRAGGWEWTTYAELHAMVERARGGLASIGVGKGDRVAIIADNRVEWVVAAYATYGLEAAFVPMYQAQLPREWVFILRDSGAKVVVVADDAAHRAIDAARAELPALEHVVGLERPASDPSSWAALSAVGARAPVPARRPSGASIASLIYTSGTTGLPKGVLLSHDNVTSNVNGVHEIFTFEPEDQSLAFLPWAHAYGQTCEVHCLLSMGCSVAINGRIDDLLTNLADVKPTILFAVPRVFNRIYEAVNQQIGARPGFAQRVIRTGIRSAIKRARGEKLGALERAELLFDERMVFSRIRDKFGGRLKYAISASATLGHDVGEFIDALGLTVYEGYGLTETSPIVSVNYPGHRKLGSVGRVLPGVRVAIDGSACVEPGQGEIVVYGPNVMVGYHERPEETHKALTADGGLRTGDLGRLDADGYLYVTGRIKEQYKLENGKYVMPSPLEEQLKLSPYVSNVILDGDGRPYNVALVVVNEAKVREWAKSHGVAIGDDVTSDPRVRLLLEKELELHGRDFKPFERPRDFDLLAEDFAVANGLLTPTLKTKRRAVLDRHRERIERLFARHAVARAS